MRMKIVSIALASILSVCGLAHAEITHLTCEQTGPTEYKLSYMLTGDTHQVAIFAGTDAQAPKGDAILTTSETTVTVHAGAPGEREYFFLKPDHGEQREVSIRHLALQGTPNFRDLGGYETTDGRFVRWGLLYRSGVLSNLTAPDFAYLSQLGIRVVCDFRTTQENATAKEIWIPGAQVKQVSLPIGGDGGKDSGASLTGLLANNPSAAELKERMTKVYGQFAFTNASEYAKVFKQLEEDHLPLLYHCTAGKDRTGVFSALLLTILGVPRSTVLEDYALTNKYLLNSMSAEDSKKMLASNPGLARLTPEQRNVLMAADPDYLKSTFAQIDEKYGSFDNYRRTALGVSDEDVETLRSRLLQR